MSPVASPLLSAVVLALVFVLMWREYRERWLGLWAIAALLWVLRYAIALSAHEFRYTPGAMFLPTIALARGWFILAGAYALLGRPVCRGWVITFLIDAVWLVRDWVSGEVLIAGARGVPHYLLFGVATIVAGLIIVSRRRAIGGEAILVCVSLVAIGASNITFPWTSQVPELAENLFLVSHGAQLGVGFGAMLLFYRRANAERDAALERLEDALSKALAGYLPICAHCKAIRNEQGQWETLERYFAHRHDTAFSHGICPPCEEKHYGHLAPAPAVQPA